MRCLTSACVCPYRCKPGFYNLRGVNPEGCQACFCFGHSLACSSSSHHVVANITSDFLEGKSQQVSSLWTAVPCTRIVSVPILFREKENPPFSSPLTAVGVPRRSHNQNKRLINRPQNEIHVNMREILLPNTCRYFSVIAVAFPSRLLSVSLLLPLFIIFTKDKKKNVPTMEGG